MAFAVNFFRQAPGPLGEAVIGFAFAIKSHALAKLGDLLAVMTKSEGGRPSKTPSQTEGVSTLADIGIDRSSSGFLGSSDHHRGDESASGCWADGPPAHTAGAGNP